MRRRWVTEGATDWEVGAGIKRRRKKEEKKRRKKKKKR